MSVLQGSVYVAQLVADSDLSGATVTCTVTAPDLTVSTSTATVAGTIASLPIPATLPGTYLVVWTTSGTVVGTVQDQFTCIAAEYDLLSLPDLKEELNINPANTKLDAKLRRWLKSASNVVENVTGPIRLHTVTDMFNGGVTSVVLNDFWVDSITSVVENWGATAYPLTLQPLGSSTTQYGYTWNKDTNALTRRDASGNMTFFAPGTNSVIVNYKAGLAVLPDDIQIAAAELIKHWYRKSQPYQGGAYGANQTDIGADMVGNYLVPNAVMEILEPWRRPPGIF